MKDVRVEKHLMKKQHPFYKMFDDYCFKSKNLYNYSNYHIRRCFIICSKLARNEEITNEEKEFLAMINSKVDDKNRDRIEKYNSEIAKGKTPKEPKIQKYFSPDNKFIDKYFASYILRQDDFFEMVTNNAAYRCIHQVSDTWKAYFEAIKSWKKNKDAFSGMPRLPSYKDKEGRNMVIITNESAKVKDGFIVFTSPKLKGFTIKTKVNNFQELRFLPRKHHIVIEVIYNIETANLLEDNNRYISIDLGLDNFATITNNCNIDPIILNGKELKSINQYYNKTMAHYRSVSKMMNGNDYTNRMNNLTMKRNNKINTLIHKASKITIDYAITCSANTIIVGNNKNWKRESNMSKKVNQKFVSIPHSNYINQITYKANALGINVITTDESYTSGTSFLDGEAPNKNNYDKSRRKHRGLFISNTGKKINADVNGSYQIMKKVFPNVCDYGIEDCRFNPVRVNL